MNFTIESVHGSDADARGVHSYRRDAVADALEGQSQHVEAYGNVANRRRRKSCNAF